MKIAIHQPDYIPYLGYFYKMAQADVFVFLDNCQFSSDNWHHWNRVKSPQGETRLKIPTDYELGKPINLVQTRDSLDWKRKHLRTLEMNYARARYYKSVYPLFQELLLASYKNLAEQNITINTWLANQFGIHPIIHYTSALSIDSLHEERIIDICLALKGTEYISGSGARSYQVEAHFLDRGLRLSYIDYHPVQYLQVWPGFSPNLSVLDYVFNCGFDWDRIMKGVSAA
ncbi:hypothetical protein AGMMS49992_30670 [Clostridia bacterium]|nr:hypothetical protein AGMMS49992_30670 [Clostridia bacterium]